MSDILVSIVCMTYNHEKYIRDAIESFLMQNTRFKYEILIHDDASTDGTVKIIEEYHQKYPEKIKPMYQKENQYSKGRMPFFINLRRAKGKYVALCEGDDYWTNTQKLQKQVDFMEKKPDYILCGHAIEVIDARTEKQLIKDPLYRFNKSREVFIEEMGENTLFQTASCLYRRDLFQQDIPKYVLDSPVKDYFLQLLAGYKGKIYYINEKMSVYRRFADFSWSKRVLTDINKYIDYIEKCINSLKEFNEFSGEKYDNYINNLIADYQVKVENIKNSHPQYIYPNHCITQESLNLFNSYKDIYIFGAGGNGKELKELLDYHNIEIKGFIDNDLSKKGSTFCMKKVYRITEVEENSMIIIASDWFKEIVEQLRKINHKNYLIFSK